MRAHLAVDEHRVGVGSPRTAEVDFLHIVGSAELAAVEYVAESDIAGSRGGCDIGITLAENVAVLEIGCRRTEDEVGCPFDVAVGKIEARVFAQKYSL